LTNPRTCATLSVMSELIMLATILINVALVAINIKLYTECQKLRVLRDEE
jgi:hypothetical protein